MNYPEDITTHTPPIDKSYFIRIYSLTVAPCIDQLMNKKFNVYFSPSPGSVALFVSTCYSLFGRRKKEEGSVEALGDNVLPEMNGLVGSRASRCRL